MKKKYKLKKSAIIIMCLFLIILIAIILFILSLFKTKSYSYEYNLNEYKISENYDDKNQVFYYEIVYNDITYNFIYNSKYIKENKLIKAITKYEADDYTCLLIKSDYITTKPLCSYQDKLIDAHLVEGQVKEKITKYLENSTIKEDTYENYQLYNTANKIFIWSYKGFTYINNSTREFIKIFDNDIYDIPLASRVNEYIVIPDYEQKHSFNKVYILNMNTLELKEWKLKYDISFDSYILGYHDKSLYIVDRKNKIEYELVPHREKMRIVGSSNKQGIIYNNNHSEKITLNKLISKDYQFKYPNNYHYELKNNTLYLTYLDYNIKTKISNQKISSIIHVNNDEVYYLVNDTLYKYNLKYGETKLISYEEWQRNNKNLIFINDQTEK